MGWDTASLDRGVPYPLPSEPGFVRWSKVDGASGYQIWFTNAPKPRIVSTITNVADLREYYGARGPGSRVEWRVRALRRVYGVAQNGLPAFLYGTWSGKYDAQLPPTPQPAEHPAPRYAVSDVTSTNPGISEHELVPAFVFSTGDGHELHRVYVATDENCVNVVHISPAVSGNVYAPRSTGGDPESFNMADLTPAKASEAVPATPVGGAGASGASLIPVDFLQNRAAIDLWDSNWPTGRYYWTVVPAGSGGDADLPQDACQAGRRGEFRKTSVKPDLANGVVPFATGLSLGGRLISAATSRTQFYGGSLATWRPAPAAAAYDVQWSRNRYPWRTAGHLRTFSTSAVLPLKPGTWWYRVRGINDSLPGNQEMSWTAPIKIKIAKPTFRVIGG
jgi:hypothetical protein